MGRNTMADGLDPSVHELVHSQHPGLRVDTKELANAYTPEPVKAGSAPAENSTVYDGDVRSPYAEFGARPVTPMDRVMRRDPAGYSPSRYVESASGVRFDGHDKYISCILLHDDNTIFTGSGDNTARQWDTQSGRCKLVYTGHTGVVLCLLVHTPSGCLYTGSLDRTVRRWDLASGEEQAVHEGHRGGVRCLDSLGVCLFVGCGNGEVQRWHLSTGEMLSKFGQHDGPVYAIKAQADLVWTGGADLKTHCWDAASGMHRYSFEGHTRYVNCIHVASGFLFTGSGDRTIRKYGMDLENPTSETNGVYIHELKGHHNTVWCMESLGEWLFSGGSDNTVIKWSIADGLELMRFEGHTSTVYTIRLKDDEKTHVGVRCGGSGELIGTATRYHLPGKPESGSLSEVGLVMKDASDEWVPVEGFPVALYSGSKDCTVRKWNVDEAGLESECFPEGSSFENKKSLDSSPFNSP